MSMLLGWIFLFSRPEFKGVRFLLSLRVEDNVESSPFINSLWLSHLSDCRKTHLFGKRRTISTLYHLCTWPGSLGPVGLDRCPGACQGFRISTCIVSELCLRFEHVDEIQVCYRFRDIDARFRVYSDVQGPSGRQHSYLAEEACATKFFVNPTAQEKFAVPLQTQSLISSTWTQCHLKN